MDTYLEFAGNHTLLVGALVFSFFLLVFTELRRKAAGLINVEPPEAVRLINADATVIDLRSVEAFARGHIVHAKNIPLDELQANPERVDKLKTNSVIAVCDSGTVSTKERFFASPSNGKTSKNRIIRERVLRLLHCRPNAFEEKGSEFRRHSDNRRRCGSRGNAAPKWRNIGTADNDRRPADRWL
jgi:rhodanese-related sulfurtransferase